MEDLLAGYRDGDSDTRAPVEQVVDGVIDEPGLFDDLIPGLTASDVAVQQRAAEAIAEIAQVQPHLLVSY